METETKKATTSVATLDASVRLVIFQLMVQKDRLPAIIPAKRAPTTPPVTPVPGVMVLTSTPELNISPLAARVSTSDDYELVDAWHKPHTTNWKMSIIQFTYCRKEYVKREELYPVFVAVRHVLVVVLAGFVQENLWAAQAYLNPYVNPDGSRTGQNVLMLACAGRKPDTQVWSGGRDQYNRGVGDKVKLSWLAAKLTLVDNEVVLEPRVPVSTARTAVALGSVPDVDNVKGEEL